MVACVRTPLMLVSTRRGLSGFGSTGIPTVACYARSLPDGSVRARHAHACEHESRPSGRRQSWHHASCLPRLRAARRQRACAPRSRSRAQKAALRPTAALATRQPPAALALCPMATRVRPPLALVSERHGLPAFGSAGIKPAACCACAPPDGSERAHIARAREHEKRPSGHRQRWHRASCLPRLRAARWQRACALRSCSRARGAAFRPTAALASRRLPAVPASHQMASCVRVYLVLVSTRRSLQAVGITGIKPAVRACAPRSCS